MKKDYKPYVYGSALLVIFILALQFDFIISKSIAGLKFNALNSIMLLFTSFIWQIVILAGASIIVFLNQKNSGGVFRMLENGHEPSNNLRGFHLRHAKRRVLHLWLSIATGLAVSVALKMIIARPRPFVDGISTISSLIKDSYTTWDLSFPSNHAVFAFAMLPFIPKKWFWPWLIISSIITFSRVYFGLHYLSDVIAGASIGLLSAYFINKTLRPKNPEGF